MKNRTILLLFTLLLSITTFAQTQNNQAESNQATEFKFQRNIQLKDCKENEILFKQLTRTSNKKMSEEIKKLHRLYKKGILTEEEYKQAKKKVLE